jgi:hypothetical protein
MVHDQGAQDGKDREGKPFVEELRNKSGADGEAVGTQALSQDPAMRI